MALCSPYKPSIHRPPRPGSPPHNNAGLQGVSQPITLGFSEISPEIWGLCTKFHLKIGKYFPTRARITLFRRICF